MNKFKKYVSASSSVDCDEKIIAYERGSFGKVMGVYNSINEVYEKESVYNSTFHRMTVYNHLHGRSKTIKLLHLQAVCVLRIKKVSELILEPYDNREIG